MPLLLGFFSRKRKRLPLPHTALSLEIPHCVDSALMKISAGKVDVGFFSAAANVA
jgi:hypothetical protein